MRQMNRREFFGLAVAAIFGPIVAKSFLVPEWLQRRRLWKALRGNYPKN